MEKKTIKDIAEILLEMKASKLQIEVVAEDVIEENDKQISDTILKQLGGINRVAAMIGVKHITYGRQATNIRFKARAKNSVNQLTIRLQPSDEYTIEFIRVRAGKSKVIETLKDVPAENLKSAVERTTGLYLSLR